MLENRADDGCLRFDLFVSERWNHDASGDSQEQGVPEDKVLDDPARYNFDDGSEDSRRQVLVRIPGITDFVA
ncbi:hypothetical protein LV164_004155 [Aspergillus fumigatus]|nr:hypothetical protein CNMCM8812_007266 [Aspergillus fumigatus]KAF4282843.1 hypothetical protein CNMCM8686_006208 [Aspergillus fumigatus]KAH1544980.1 hypothetical protein KXX57_005113 [Aspergillus fumigatus]KAH1615579.1 hypothetical protein KXX21_000792 [Aspergillus fumigatus]KAH1851434.1 hypothetical protein KXX55_009086 [Aspergillus fumigatus]